MRIKCPNSDVVLELPGDRTDMKFTCPACHKVHRVTITITTPGEDPPPTAVAKATAHMPKKYATGAFAPVVDIPIDANFVLVDPADQLREQNAQQGIDLGQAARPNPDSILDADLSARKTEIYTNRKEKAFDAPQDNPDRDRDRERDRRDDPDKDNPPHGGARGKSGLMWDDLPDTPPPPPRGSDREAPASDRYYRNAARRKRRRDGPHVLRNILLGLLLILLAAAGYLAWQQNRFDKTVNDADAHLELADAAWNQGDAATAAQDAKNAREDLKAGEAFLTPHKLWNRLADSTGLVADAPSPVRTQEAKIRKHLDRETALDTFRRSLDPADAHAAAKLLRDVKPAAGQDPSLADALDSIAVDAVIAHLENAAPSWTPEISRAQAENHRSALAPALGTKGRRDFENRLSSFIETQRRRLGGQIRERVNAVADLAKAGSPAAIEDYQALKQRIGQADSPELAGPIPSLADPEHRDALEQLDKLTDLVAQARHAARTVLSLDGDDFHNTDAFSDEARKLDSPNRKLSDAAIGLIEDTNAIADDLLGLRIELYGRIQSEMRRSRENPGTRMAWSMLLTAFADPEIEVDPSGFRYDSNRASMAFAIKGVPGVMEMEADDYEKRFKAALAGYRFETGWVLLFHKPLVWMADLAQDMRKAGVDPDLHPDWELLEGPGAPLALSRNPSQPDIAGAGAYGSVPQAAAERQRHIFFKGRLLPARDLPAPAGARAFVDNFRQAAERLETAVMTDESIPQPLRQALKPVLMGTHQPPDPRDFFDSAFCRRLIEADYLETYLDPMPAAIKERLAEYREALGKLEAGYDEFSAELPDDEGTLYGVNRLDRDFSSEGKGSDQDPDSGESLPRLTWRVEQDGGTRFFSPQPARFVYAFMLAEEYPGRHRVRPAGVPVLTEVWHANRGRIASYRNGDDRAQGDDDLWNLAIEEDLNGRLDPTTGPPGWNYPLHVLQRDDQGDPVLLATLSGTVESPDFSDLPGPEARRRAEDDWLDRTAITLATPGELGLIFHQFFRYCSDSPLPELPNLIGSHFGLSDTHQTVYESLERRWVGRLIGDCDDLAEFFQVLTRRQGKLSHVMQLPGHAAAGYVDRLEDGEAEDGAYRFVVLQTGPVLQFVADSLPEVVEMAYRSFDRGDGMSHMTTDAVPLLLRFADEETRTPFVLSSRIYGDSEYAEKMIEVQSYWHEHAYSSALEIMEEMVAQDPEIGSIKELGSLYERVGHYDESAEMRRRELELVRDNPQQELSTLLEIAQLHLQDKDRDQALVALGEMEEVMRRMIRMDDAPTFFGAMTFRSYWAMLMARLDLPERAWDLVRYDAVATKRQLGRVAEPVLRTMVVLYDRMRMREAGGQQLTEEEKEAGREVGKELDEAFGRGYFKADDSYNTIINRYFVLGRYAVSDVGREEGLERLRRDGPYPTAAKDQTKRTRGLDDEDWSWFRITPQLYLGVGMEMLDEDEYPELYDPAGARPLLEDVSRAIEKGRGLGSDVAGGDDAVKAELTLSFLNNDLGAFRRAMAVVKEKDYSSLYDDAAMTFGLNCGLIPLAEFPAWAEAFREFFPGTQHYFKVVYRAIDKEHYDHALAMAEATAKFFPDNALLVKEARFVRSIIPGLKERKASRNIPHLKAS